MGKLLNTKETMEALNFYESFNRENIVKHMLAGSTCFWEYTVPEWIQPLSGDRELWVLNVTKEGKWVFCYIEKEDVFDRIFGMDKTTALVKIYDRLLPLEQRQAIEDRERVYFNG